MEAGYKDEIYVPWHENSTNVINALCTYFTTTQQDIEVHIFAHKQRLLEVDVAWPENFSFHVSKTTSDHALSTALIAFVLEKYQRISDSLLAEEKTDEVKVKVFFIQESLDQFEELKALLTKKPFLTDTFSFKLLALSDEIQQGSDFLFEKLKGKKRSSRHNNNNNKTKSNMSRSLSENDKSPLIKHGRRAANPSTASTSSTSSLTGNHKALDGLPSRALRLPVHNHSNPSSRLSTPMNGMRDCEHCDRRRGSKPGFSMEQKNLFCLACYLNKDEEEDEDENICKICLRSMHIETTDQETMIEKKYISKNKGVQCNVSELNGKSTSTQYSSNSISVACQTDDIESNGYAENEPDLQDKFYELMGKISANQDDLGNQVNGAPNDYLISGFRLNEIPKNSKTNKYHCPFCPTKLFGRQEIFEVHLKNVHKKCNCSCDHYFESLEAYLEHFYEVFPLHCFVSRKCPERFRTIHYQAIHHSDLHYSLKPYICPVCYENEEKVSFKDINALKNHAIQYGHAMEHMFFSTPIDEHNESIPMTARSSAINFSG